MCGQGKNSEAEVDNDVIEAVGVSSDSDVVPCFLSPDSLAPADLLTDGGYMCLPCGPQRFDSQFEKSFCHASRTQAMKDRKDLCSSKVDFPW